MPILTQRNAQNKLVQQYKWYGDYITPTLAIGNWLRKERKLAATDANTGDKGAQRRLKAINFLLPWFDGAANQPVIAPRLWPLGLVDDLDQLTRQLILRFG